MNYDNVNTCIAPVPNNDCCVKSTPADRTIKDNIMDSTEFLSDIEAHVDRIKNFLLFSDDEKAPNIDITDLSSKIIRNLEFEKRILKKLMFIVDRLGC